MSTLFYRGALFHMKTRVTLKYFVTDCSSWNSIHGSWNSWNSIRKLLIKNLLLKNFNFLKKD